MPKSKSSDSPIVGILNEGDAWVPVEDLQRTDGLSKATLFTWRSQSAGVTVQAYTTRATAMVAPGVGTLLDADYCRRFRHARKPMSTPTSPMPSRSSEVPGSGV
jgi:hypothetical protein